MQSRGGICTPVHTVCSRFGPGKEASAIVPSSSSRCCSNRVDGERVWQPNEEDQLEQNPQKIEYESVKDPNSRI